MEKVYVRDLKEKQQIESVFLVRSKALPQDKNGKTYLNVILMDKTGQVDARAWDNLDVLAYGFSADDYVKVKANVQVHQGRKQLILTAIQRVPTKDVNVGDFLPASKQNAEIMFKTLLAIVNGMENKHIKKLVLDTLNDPQIQPNYLKCPAAKTIHHAWVGGLLEHTLSICRIMLFLGKHYEGVNTDLLIFGAIFHDIGKIWELSYEHNFSYTDSGRLLGHLVIGTELIEKKASAIPGFPEELKNMCKHIVLSHHGKLEYGSPKVPSFLEAMIVAMIDDFDSKVAAIQQFVEQEKSKGESWTGFHPMFERHFYIPKPAGAGSEGN